MMKKKLTWWRNVNGVNGKMVRIVDRIYLAQLVKQNYCDQETNCFFYGESNCHFCKKSKILQEEVTKKSSTL